MPLDGSISIWVSLRLLAIWGGIVPCPPHCAKEIFLFGDLTAGNSNSLSKAEAYLRCCIFMITVVIIILDTFPSSNPQCSWIRYVGNTSLELQILLHQSPYC